MEGLIKELQEMRVSFMENCSLAERSSFRIGGCARLGIFPESRASLMAVLGLLSRSGIPFLTVGNGSNLVFPDEGFAGAVVFTTRCRGLQVTGDRILADAGVSLRKIGVAACDAGLTGAEFAHGIPGTLGGALVMNAGAYGGSMEDICVSSEYYDTRTGCLGRVEGDAHAFGYRTSFYHKLPHCVILGAELKLARGNEGEIRQRMAELEERRKSTQPLELPSAGSVFKRPEGYFAGKLIQDCGLKGLTVGGAQVSEKHAGFIVNRGGATARDVKALVEQIRDTVLRQTNVDLECEIRFL